MKIKYLFCVITLVLLMTSCFQKSNKEKAIALIEKLHKDSIIRGDRYSNIEYGEIDSVFTNIYETSAYHENDNNLYEYYDKFEKEITDYEYEKARFGTGISRGLILLYQDYIRECLKRKNQLEKSFIPEFKGYRISEVYTHLTSFGDSAKFYSIEFNKDMNKIIDIQGVDIPIDLYNKLKIGNALFDDKKSSKITRDFYSEEIKRNSIKESSDLMTIDTTRFIK